MRKIIILTVLFNLFFLIAYTKNEKTTELEHLTLDSFKEKIFNFEKNTEWKYLGDKPCIIDFYADWCGPCKMVAPIMVELADEYRGKVDIYKVNTDEQRQLAGMFGIRSIPSILFVPVEGKPQMMSGALPKEAFEKYIKEILFGEKEQAEKSE